MSIAIGSISYRKQPIRLDDVMSSEAADSIAAAMFSDDMDDTGKGPKKS